MLGIISNLTKTRLSLISKRIVPSSMKFLVLAKFNVTKQHAWLKNEP